MLKISIEEVNLDEEEEVIIKCHHLDDKILQLIHNIKTNENMVIGYNEEKIHRISPKSIYYFESVDNRVYIYCKEQVFESKQKLYEIEEKYGSQYFLRISKSIILNIKKIKYVSPAYSGRLEACLDNGEKQVISRQYVSVLKKKLGI